MRLFFIAAEADSEGHSSAMNLDLFVRARDHSHALGFWRQHYELEAADQPDTIFEVDARNKRAGSLAWGGSELRRIWRRK